MKSAPDLEIWGALRFSECIVMMPPILDFISSHLVLAHTHTLLQRLDIRGNFRCQGAGDQSMGLKSQWIVNVLLI